jgi:hypothetical protein
LAEHAWNARSHVASDGGPRPARPGIPALIWVADDGVYLMSNGLPQPPRDDGAHAVFADGWHAGSGADRSGTDIGADDGYQHIPFCP